MKENFWGKYIVTNANVFFFKNSSLQSSNNETKVKIFIMRIKHIYTQLSTPCTESSQRLTLLPIKSLQSSIVKLSQCPLDILKASTTSLNQSQVRSSKRKQSKLSILHLRREKSKLLYKNRRRGQQVNNSSRCEAGWSTKKQIQNQGKVYTQFFTMLSFMNNKVKRKCFKIQVMIDDLIVYFSTKSEKQWNKQVCHVVKISQMIKRKVIFDEPGQLKYEALKQCQGQLSKLFFNICYELYLYKRNLHNLNILSLIHRDIEYYSRRLGMLNLTILSCMDMGRLYCDFFQMDRAAVQYNKVVKLAVFLGDKYSQQLAIDRLGMCEYYKGDIVSAFYFHNSTDKLSSYDKWKIYKYYSNENQIQKILQQKTKQKSIEQQIKQQFFRHKQNYQFNFDSMNKDNEYVQKNYQVFRNNVKQMIKVNTLRKHVPMIKQALVRAQKIGERSYCGRQYCIPRASRYHIKNSQRSREEFIMSHRSYNRNNLAYQSVRIDKHCKIIDQILNFLSTEQRNKIKQIKEQRQSYMSDENI